MDPSATLIRSLVRAFYPTEQILILDAILLHHAIAVDDLSLLIGQPPKTIRRIAGKLREDGLFSIHNRAEMKSTSNRPFNREYYWVDIHRAIDAVKYKIKTMVKEIDKRYGQSVEEKKEWRCPQCKNEYTELDVLDSIGVDGFDCKRCGHKLESLVDVDERNGVVRQAGHEVQSRLNAQMVPFEEILQQIDNEVVPESTFDSALEKALPVERNQNTNPAVKSEPVLGKNNLPPATVHGMKTEPERVEVSMMDDEKRAAEREEEAKRRAKIAAQNALPAWHTASTVTGQPNGLGPHGSSPLANGETVNGTAVGFKRKREDDEEEEKKVDKLAIDSDVRKDEENKQLQAYFDALGGDEEDEEEENSESEDESEDESDDDEGSKAASPEEPAAKRVRIEEPSSSSGQQTPNGDDANGITPGESDEDH